MADVNSRNQRGYVQLESAYGTIPNTAGAASVGNSNAFLLMQLLLNPTQALIQRPDKTGTLSPVLGVGGRKSGSGTMRCTLAGSGAAGSAPDIGPFLQALFGKAPVITASTSVLYGVDDNQYSLAVFDFWTPSTAVQSIGFGTIIQSGRFTAGGDTAEAEFTLQSRWIIDSNQFSTAATADKGGLTSFPSEPSSPATNGNMVTGFTGVATLDGTAYTTLRTVTIQFNANRDLPSDVFASYYPGNPGQDTREITVQFSMYDTDAAALNTLKRKAISQTPVTLVFQVGTTAGNIWTFTLNNVLLTPPQTDDSQRRKVVNFNGRAHASSLSAKDEFSLLLT